MPKPGKRPLPTKMKELRGGRKTYHKAPPKNEAKPKTTERLPRAPAYLNKVAQAEWRRVVKELHPLGLLTKIDTVSLSAYCVCFAGWVDATAQVQKHGVLIKSPNNVPMQSPYLSIANRAMVEMRKWLVEFGMTPSSRTRVTATESEKEDPLKDFMSRGGKPYKVK